MRKYVCWVRGSSGIALSLIAVVMVAFGCSQGVKSQMPAEAVVKSEDQEFKLLEMLTRSQNLAAELRILVTDDDLTDNPFAALADDLDETRIRILNYIQSRGFAVHHPEVLAQVDYLILLISDGGDLKLGRRLDQVEEEARKKFEELAKNLQQLKADLKNFEDQVNNRFAAVESDIQGLKQRDEELTALIKEVDKNATAANIALRVAFKELQDYTKKEIAELYKVSGELKKKLEEQYKIFDELLAAHKEVDVLQGKMCSVDGQGQINDARGACTGTESDLGSANCCLTLDKVNCGVLFPSEVQLPARNQCNIIIATLKNHSAQLSAIREVDAKQSELIKGILGEIDDLRKQDEILAKGIEVITETLGKVVSKLEQIDKDLVIIKFKLARGEAAASLKERADLYLAWVARRSSDVRRRFCRKNVNAALNSFDYKAARQNWDYCRERIEWLTQAKELVQVAKAYTNGLEAINVDSPCGVKIAGKSASGLTNAELINPAVFKAVVEQCDSGAVLARAKMFNVLKLLDTIGPDFRTTGYIAKQAEIAQILATGKLVANMTLGEKREFENTDPTSPEVASTYYGRIERVFKKRYVESKMRTLAGQFPEDPTTIPAAVHSFDVVFSHRELAQGNGSSTERLRDLEVQGPCAECGWKVDGRHGTERTAGPNVKTSKGGRKRFAFPNDPQPLCPVINDVVGVEGKDGKIYAYRLNYHWIFERLTPVVWSGGHVKLAESRSDALLGNFRRTSYKKTFVLDRVGLPLARLGARTVVRVSKPYGRTYAGRGQCRAFRLASVPRDDNKFGAPTNQKHNFTRYIKGLDPNVLLDQCRKSMINPTVVTTVLDRNATSIVDRTRSIEILNDLIVFSGAIDGDPVRKTIIDGLTAQTTQLGSGYWVFDAKNNQGQSVNVNYGVGNLSLSKYRPFYSSYQSHGDVLIRNIRKSAGPLAFQECRLGE